MACNPPAVLVNTVDTLYRQPRLLQIELHREAEIHAHRLALQGGGLEAPALDGCHRRLAETQRQSPQDLDIVHLALLVDHRLEDHDPLETGPAGKLGVERLGREDLYRSGDLASHRNRSIGFKGRGRGRKVEDQTGIGDNDFGLDAFGPDRLGVVGGGVGDKDPPLPALRPDRLRLGLGRQHAWCLENEYLGLLAHIRRGHRQIGELQRQQDGMDEQGHDRRPAHRFAVLGFLPGKALELGCGWVLRHFSPPDLLPACCPIGPGRWPQSSGNDLEGERIVRYTLLSFTNGHAIIADMPTHNPYETYLGHLRHLPFIEKTKVLEFAPAGYQFQPDALLLVTTPQGDHRFLVEEKRTHLTYTIADGVIAQMDRETRYPWILFAPHVAPPMARHLMENGVFFVDRVGNCHFAIGRDHIVQIEGRKPDKTTKKARGLGAAGHQALFAILAKPELLNAPVRALAEAAGIGKTAAAETLHRLQEQGVIGRGHRERHLLQRDLVLDRWLAGYENFLRPRLTVGTFRRPDPDPAATEEWIERNLNGEINWAWGGGTAAMRLTGHYRGEGTLLYLEAEPVDIQDRLQALPAKDGPLTVLRAPGPIALEGAAPRTTHPLLVYTDLLDEGGERAREAAKEIHHRFLERA